MGESFLRLAGGSVDRNEHVDQVAADLHGAKRRALG